MEDIIESLKRNRLDVPAPIYLPDSDELVCIEEELLISMPYDLRSFLLEVSDVVYGSLQPVTATDTQARTHLPDVAAEAWDIGIPRHLIPICQSKDNYYCISDDGEISLWNANEQSNETWLNIWQWVREVWLKS